LACQIELTTTRTWKTDRRGLWESLVCPGLSGCAGGPDERRKRGKEAAHPPTCVRISLGRRMLPWPLAGRLLSKRDHNLVGTRVFTGACASAVSLCSLDRALMRRLRWLAEVGGAGASASRGGGKHPNVGWRSPQIQMQRRDVFELAERLPCRHGQSTTSPIAGRPGAV